jgi:hypothetical protein
LGRPCRHRRIDGIRSQFAARSLSVAKAEPELADPAFKIL